MNFRVFSNSWIDNLRYYVSISSDELAIILSGLVFVHNYNCFNNVADRYYGYNTNMARIFGSLFRHTLGDIGSNLR